MKVKVYCEHGAVCDLLRRLQRDGKIELVQFPYDPDSKCKHIARSAVPSAAQYDDMNLTWEECGDRTWDDFSGSDHFAQILDIIGRGNRRDAMHVDSAYKTGCICIVTADSDILSKRDQLQTLLHIRVFAPNDRNLESFLLCQAGNLNNGRSQ